MSPQDPQLVASQPPPFTAGATPLLGRPKQKIDKDTRRSLLGIGLGNGLEWFDGTLYATLAVYVSAAYFDSSNPAASLLATLAVFAVGFLARPFGGFLFGWLTDRFGRKFGLTLAVALMSVGLAMIALTPTYESIGLAAPIVLLLARIIQGVSQGGETPASQAFLAELAPAERRGLWSSLIYVSGTIGVLATVLVNVLMNFFFTAEQMHDFAWRIPFAVAAVLGLYTLWMRRTMKEPEVYAENAKAGKTKIFANAIKHRKALLMVVGLTVGFTTSYYALIINTPTYGSVALGYDRQATLWASVIGNLVLIVSLPLWGKLSDKIGRKPVLYISFISMAVLYIPGVALMSLSINHMIGALVVFSIFMGGPAAIFPATLAELFPTEVRATGIGVPYALAVAIFGGTAPYLQQLAASLNTFNFFPIYIVVLLVCSVLTVRTIPETRGKDLE
ncbi:MFS transporter [Arthrobacter sp. 18067]|uniref:MFS transporter n=1 Tax=Arthrobacter sp. 18067 TaxID=2681413 RepID=UPI00135B86A6|nr:MFS transporter [Arthrobacter sp. 18067]